MGRSCSLLVALGALVLAVACSGGGHSSPAAAGSAGSSGSSAGGADAGSAGAAGSAGTGGDVTDAGGAGGADAGCAHTLCGGVCVDTQSDAQNCGACGTQCAGTCTAGRCLVTLYAAAQSSAAGLALGAGSAYLGLNSAGQGSVLEVPLDGGAPLTLASGSWSVQGLGADASGVYFAAASPGGSGAIMWSALDGSGSTQLVTGLADPSELAVGPNDLFWVDTSSTGQVVQQSSQVGGTPTTLYSTASSNIRAVAADYSGVYWAESGTQGGVWFVPIGTSTPQQLNSTATSAWALALDSQHLYWLDNDDAMLLQGPRSPGLPKTIAMGQPLVTPESMASDGASLYWSVGDAQSGSLMKTDPGSLVAPVQLAHGAWHVVAMALDANSIYFATDTGQLLQLTPR